MMSHFELLTPKFLQKFLFRLTNSTSYNNKFHFELLTLRLNFNLSTFELDFELPTLTNSKRKNKKFHFELLTQWLKFYFVTFKLQTRS